MSGFNFHNPEQRKARPFDQTAWRKAWEARSLSPVAKCQWVIGEPSDGHYCHAPAVEGQPYCPQHPARAFRPRANKMREHQSE